MSSSIMVCHHYRIDTTFRQSPSHPIYFGTNVQNGQAVVLKSEDADSHFSFNGYSGSRMFYEGKALQTLQGGVGIPNMHWCGQDNDFNFLIMERLGLNLESLLKQCNGKFSLKTVLMLAYESLSVIHFLHYKGLLHRAVSPNNFAIGYGKKNAKLYIIDFSTAVRYRLLKNNQHFKEGYKGFNLANQLFSSANVNKGYDGSRRDDLQSWFYMVIYLLKGKLPWLATGDNEDEKYNCLKLKENTSNVQLCQGLHKGFAQLGAHISELKYSQRPAYTFMKNLLRDMLRTIGEDFDYVYDWMLIPTQPNPKNLVDCLKLRLPVVPNEAAFLKEQYRIFLQEQAEKHNIENVLRSHVQSSVNDATNIPFREQLKPPKQCVIF